jgi:hypothetical protein
MKTHFKTIGLLVLFSLSLPAWSIGADGDGSKLLSDCGAALAAVDGQKRDNSNVMGIGFCLGLMRGMLDMNQIYVAHLKGAALFCQPDESTNDQAARIVLKYLRDHPEELHKPGTVLTFTALRGAFPCAKK